MTQTKKVLRFPGHAPDEISLRLIAVAGHRDREAFAILFRLHEATHPSSADAPGFRLHPLKKIVQGNGVSASQEIGVWYSALRMAKLWT